jgi:chaperone required for assembly of F1-ATPase
MTEVPKICVAEADLFHADRQTDSYEKVKVFLQKRLKSLAPVEIQTPVRNLVTITITLSRLQASKEMYLKLIHLKTDYEVSDWVRVAPTGSTGGLL